MFKGLRTKIESEQKGGASIPSGSPVQSSKNSIPNHKETKDPERSLLFRDGDIPSKESSINVDRKIKTVASEGTVFPLANPQVQPLDIRNPDMNSDRNDLFEKVNDLTTEITTLKDQINSLAKEREECNDQNLQLYQLIEKLRRNLECEKENNSSLEKRLIEAETSLKERDSLIESLRSSPRSVSLKSFSSRETTSDEPQTVENLRMKISDLQDQLSEKTRQIRIRNQNINDIKKALQREMYDHSKTQDELNKLQSQLKQQIQNKSDQTSSDDLNIQNGSTSCDIEANLKTDNTPQSDALDGGQSMVSHDKNENILHPQMDRISMLSRSSASVDDFDSNDLQTNCDKEVNHEYLRNVLFRYMTSTDTVTAKHLVKAISVMMNFTPEQSAAVRSAISARTSWLRLK